MADVTTERFLIRCLHCHEVVEATTVAAAEYLKRDHARQKHGGSRNFEVEVLQESGED